MSAFQTSGQRTYSDVTRPFLSCEGSGTPDYIPSGEMIGGLTNTEYMHVKCPCVGIGFLCQSPYVAPYSDQEGGSGALQ